MPGHCRVNPGLQIAGKPVKLASRGESAPCRLRSMSEFKFACPVCGQHITCDARTSGSQMECPTCFRKLTVPQPPATGSPNLVLTRRSEEHTSELQSRG